MARKKKKDRIVVDLDLPKDDSTMTKLYAILGISVFLGLGSMGFWLLNSGFVPTGNGQPMFVNMACGFDPNTHPTYADNESCALLKDHPDELTWSPKTWKDVRARGQTFDIPGINETFTEGVTVLQPLELDCDVVSDRPTNVTVMIRNNQGEIIEKHDFVSGKAGESCGLEIEHIPPGNNYEVDFLADGSGLTTVDFTISVEYYDGIPTYMNNKSLWIGPPLDLGPMQFRPTIFLNFFGFGWFLLFFPASFYWDRVQNSINEMEEKFPDFLRDMAEYWKGGLSMTIAVQTLATSEYGSLNDEVKKMSDQLSWGIAFGDVIDLFATRVNTPLVKRAISLISEANKAGGKISDILVTAANDSRELKFLEGERKRAISSYIAVIWVSYMVFLGVIVVLAKVFIPAIASSNSGDEGSSDQSIGNMSIRAIDPLFFLTVFFYGVTMQAMGNGAMAGLMATGRFSSGMKHAGMMILLAIFSFNVIAYTPDLIGVNQVPGLSPGSAAFTPTGI